MTTPINLADLQADLRDTKPGARFVRGWAEELGEAILDAPAIAWCKQHDSPFNDHEGACIEWLAVPDDTICDVVSARVVEVEE